MGLLVAMGLLPAHVADQSELSCAIATHAAGRLGSLVGVRVSYEKQFSADFMAHAIMLHSFSAKLR